MRTSYNVRIVDNGDGTFDIPWAHKFKKNKGSEGGEWKDSSPRAVRRLLGKAFAAWLSR